MHKQTICLAAIAFALCTAGCSSSSSSSFSCTFSSTSTLASSCYQWTSPQSLTSQQISDLSTACTSASTGATFSQGQSCSTTNSVGTCSFSSPESGVTYGWVFYSPTYNTTSGAAFCAEAQGTWTAG